MTKEECEATGGSVQSVLGVDSEVRTQCTVPSSNGRRRNSGDTWDAKYTMVAESQDEANELGGQLNDPTTRNAIKSQIESDTGATVSSFEAEAAFVTEPKGKSGSDSGIGAPAIVGIIAGVAIVGAALGFVIYKVASKKASEAEAQLSPRLLNGGFQPITRDLEAN